MTQNLRRREYFLIDYSQQPIILFTPIVQTTCFLSWNLNNFYSQNQTKLYVITHNMDISSSMCLISLKYHLFSLFLVNDGLTMLKDLSMQLRAKAIDLFTPKKIRIRKYARK